MNKYLVVDDSKMARKMTISVIKELVGSDDGIVQARNGQEAFDLYKEYRPRLVFMDLTMPVMDGFDAILKIKDFDCHANIIVVSADIQKGAMQKAKDNGALDFINKPIDVEKTRAVIGKLGL